MPQMRDSPRPPPWVREMAGRLAAVLRTAGWRVEEEPKSAHGRCGADMLIRRGPLAYAVDVGVAGESRRVLMESMLAKAILQAGVHARELGVRPLAILGAPQVSRRMAEGLRAYARRFGGKVSWGFLDAGESFELHGEGLDGIQAEPSVQAARHDPVIRRRDDPLSDLGQWMLKVLLAPRLKTDHLTAPRVEIRNASHLAELASVSVASASRFLGQLRSLGFVAPDRRRVRLVRISELMQRWRSSAAAIPVDVRARWLLPDKGSADPLGRALGVHLRSADQAGPDREGAMPNRSGPRACMGLFAASARLGFEFVHGAPTHLLLEEVSTESLESLGLVPAGPDERCDVIVRRPRCPEAVFRASVVRDGVPVADILQCWLDVANHPARGDELADLIWRRELKTRLLGG